MDEGKLRGSEEPQERGGRDGGRAEPRAARSAFVTRMFDAYGTALSPSRLDTYLDVLQGVPTDQLKAAIDTAMRESKDYPPGPGHVFQCWKAAHTKTHYTPHGFHEVSESIALESLPAPRDVPLGDGDSWRVRLFDKARELRRSDPLRTEREGRYWSYTEAARVLGGNPKTWLPR